MKKALVIIGAMVGATVGMAGSAVAQQPYQDEDGRYYPSKQDAEMMKKGQRCNEAHDNIYHLCGEPLPLNEYYKRLERQHAQEKHQAAEERVEKERERERESELKARKDQDQALAKRVVEQKEQGLRDEEQKHRAEEQLRALNEYREQQKEAQL